MLSAPRLRSPAAFFCIVAVDAALIIASFVAACYLTLLMDPYVFFYGEDGAAHLVPLAAIMLLAMYLAGLYARQRRASRMIRAQQLSLAAGIALLFEAFLSWIDPGAILPRNLTLAGIAISFAVLFAWRTALDAILQRFSGPRPVLFLGGGATLRELAEYIGGHPELDLSIAGSLTGQPGAAVAPVLGGPGDLSSVVQNVKPELIIAGTDENRDQFCPGDLIELRFSGATIEEAGAACEVICRRVSARDLRPSRVLFTRDFEPHTGQLLTAIADRIIAAILLLIGSPIALAWMVSLAITGHRIIRRKVCAGFRGALFTSRRFLAPQSGAISRLARALRLDRYPDLWNVIAGRMSMVGPRPVNAAVDRELADLIPVYEYRRNAKPGLASLAKTHPEIRGPVPDSLREVEYDLYYVRHQSPALYAFVLLDGIRRAIS